MDYTEAKGVYVQIVDDTYKLHVKLSQIGNGEFVVIINSYFYIWSMDDWYKNMYMWLDKNSSTRIDTSSNEPYLHPIKHKRPRLIIGP